MKKKRRQPYEKDIQSGMMGVLRHYGFLVLKYRSAGIKKDDGSYIPMSRTGVSDLLCCAPDGRFVAIEVKRPGNKPTQSQREFLEEVDEHGGIAMWADDVEQIIDFCKRYEKGEFNSNQSS